MLPLDAAAFAGITEIECNEFTFQKVFIWVTESFYALLFSHNRQTGHSVSYYLCNTLLVLAFKIFYVIIKVQNTNIVKNLVCITKPFVTLTIKGNADQ